MTVRVTSTLEAAIRVLGRQRLADGLEKELKVRRFAKRSERIRFKSFLSWRRKLRNAARNKK